MAQRADTTADERSLLQHTAVHEVGTDTEMRVRTKRKGVLTLEKKILLPGIEPATYYESGTLPLSFSPHLPFSFSLFSTPIISLLLVSLADESRGAPLPFVLCFSRSKHHSILILSLRVSRFFRFPVFGSVLVRTVSPSSKVCPMKSKNLLPIRMSLRPGQTISFRLIRFFVHIKTPPFLCFVA